jgi:NTE family protein
MFRFFRLGIFLLLSGLGLPVGSAGAQQTAPSPVPKRPVVAVVLAGGSAMGLSHIGVLEVLEEMGIPIDIVVGTSIGAMVGGAYAIGYSPSDMEEFISKVNWSKMFSEDPPRESLSYRERRDKSQFFLDLPFNFDRFKLKNGLLLGQNIAALMDRMTFKTPEDADFDQFPRRFRAVATDIANGQEMVFSHGSLSDALRASMSLPGLFAPGVVDGHYYVDGGVVDNLPIGVAKAMGADIIIAVTFDMHIVKDVSELNGNPLASAQRSMDIMVNSNVKRQIAEADVVITPDMSDTAATTFYRWKDLIQKGRDAALAAAPQLQKVLDRTGTVPLNPRSPGIYFTRQPNSQIAAVEIEGGSSEDQLKARQVFSRYLGKAPSADEFEAPVDELLRTGNFDAIKVRNEPVASGVSKLKLQLIPRTEGINSLFFGLSYWGTYDGSAHGQVRVMNQVDLRNLTGPGSDWSTEGEFVDILRIKTSYYQPLGSWFFLSGTFEAMQPASVSSFPLLDSVFYANGLNANASFGLHPIPGADIATGLSYESYQQVPFPDLVINTGQVTADTYFVRAVVDKRDSAIFPMDGFAYSATYRTTMPGATDGYTVFTGEGEAGLSLATPFSVILLGKFGSDFSQGSPASGFVPVFYLPTLADRRMFPGLTTEADAIGNDVGALGIEIKYQPRRFVPGLAIPYYFILQGAAGEASTDTLNFDFPPGSLRWNLAGGAGLKISDSFGILFRVGWNFLWSRSYPYVAIDVGSFARQD